MKNKLFNAFLILLVATATCAAILTGSYFKSGFAYKVGDFAAEAIKATGTVENRVATEKNKIEAAELAAEIKPFTEQDAAATQLVLSNISHFLNEIENVRASFAFEQEDRRQREAARFEAARLAEAQRRVEEDERRRTEESFSEEEDESDEDETSNETADEQEIETDAEETAGESEDESDDGEEEPSTIPAAETEPSEEDREPYAAYAMLDETRFNFTANQKDYILTLSDESFGDFKNIVLGVAGDLLERGVRERDAETNAILRDSLQWSPLNDVEQVLGRDIINKFLEPNIVDNEEMTRINRERAAENYETVYVYPGETIVGENERITDETYAIMEDLGMLNTGIIEKIIPMAGVFILIAALFAACLMHMSFYRKKENSFRKESILVCTLYCIVLAVIWLLDDVPYPYLPVLVFPMLVSILIDVRTSVLLTLGLVFVGFFTVGGTLEYLLFFTTSGTFVCLLAKYTTDRNKVFMVGILAAVVNFILSCSVSFILISGNIVYEWQSVLVTASFTALNGMLTVIVCMGSLPFWEAFFGIVTPVKLLDLTNPTNLLLRRLTIEAPGTYHHSLIVANLAETAAYDIGANPHTARVGGYYHDIGKLKYPQYFSENIAGENPHDGMDPFSSAQLIISHISYGRTLAQDYRLPQFIRDIISEHHGTSLIYYFYHKAKTDCADQQIDEKDFRYPFAKPQTRESACVMLADTVEAAVRSMAPRVKSVDEVKEQITTLIRNILNDGQLAESQLSIKDIETIGESFFRVLKGMYHERIAYPKKPEEPIKDGPRKGDTGRTLLRPRAAKGEKT